MRNSHLSLIKASVVELRQASTGAESYANSSCAVYLFAQRALHEGLKPQRPDPDHPRIIVMILDTILFFWIGGNAVVTTRGDKQHVY